MIDSFNYKHPEYQYLTLMRNILENGVKVEIQELTVSV